MAVHQLGRLLCRATCEGAEPLTAQEVKEHLPWRRLPIRLRNESLWNEGIEWARTHRTTQPINFVMQRLGYDGIVNHHADTNAVGSVVYDPPQDMLIVPQDTTPVPPTKRRRRGT